MDAGAEEGVLYRYTAFRRQVVKLDGHTLELRSTSSGTVEATWHDVYPPAVPVGLVALGYDVPGGSSTTTESATQPYAVDLVWQPVQDKRLAGYLVYREVLGSKGEPSGPRRKLIAEPVPTPGFHDSTAKANERYRYSVSAIDPKGNESGVVSAMVDPTTR